MSYEKWFAENYTRKQCPKCGAVCMWSNKTKFLCTVCMEYEEKKEEGSQ